VDYKILPPGNNVPQEVYAIIEIPKGQGRIKYEYRTNGILLIDRLRGADQPLYPVHYCGIPATQAPDGDPLDVLILGDDALRTGDVMAVRPIAVFWMMDEKGIDPKIVAVPADSVSDEYLHIRNLADIPAEDRQRIGTFFQEYKKNDLQGKWSTTSGWDDLDQAHKTILECVERWNRHVDPKPVSVSRPEGIAP
jgi:inorganic pyrophosphatase